MLDLLRRRGERIWSLQSLLNIEAGRLQELGKVKSLASELQIWRKWSEMSELQSVCVRASKLARN